MTMVERLLRIAADLAETGVHSLTMKRRAVSTAYYAAFHALAELCADEVLGGAFEHTSAEYTRVYRALDHGTLKTAFKVKQLSENAAITRIGELVVELQSERIRADYLPVQRLYTKIACQDLITKAHTAIKEIKKLNDSERKILAVHLLFKNR